MAGVAPHETPAAHLWQKRLHWVMLALAALVIPAFYLHAVSDDARLHHIAESLDWIILAGFTLELVWMVSLCRDKWRYLVSNWLSVLIILAALLSVVGIESEMIALVRLLRIATIALLVTRVLGSLTTITPEVTPFLLVLGLALLALAGGGFYWLEPTVHSYADGLWLAFASGATVGYGDIVPTTPASKIFAVVVVVVGVAMLSLVTASLTAYFIGKEETRLRHEMHQDIKGLREEVRLLREEIARVARLDKAHMQQNRKQEQEKQE